MLVQKTVGAYILLVFGALANAASIGGLWLSYASAPPDAQARFGRFLLMIGSIGAASAYLVIASLLFLRLRRPANDVAISPAVAPSPPIALPPDATLKDTDPRLEVGFVDDRWATHSKDYAYFELINRGQSEAQGAYIEPFQVGSHRVNLVKFKMEPLIPPSHSSRSFYVEIEQADNSLSKLDIFDVFYQEWQALKRQQLHELPIPIKAIYQDAARNLFEARCELVFYPAAHIKKIAGVKVLETRNHKFRRVAAAIPRINWA